MTFRLWLDSSTKCEQHTCMTQNVPTAQLCFFSFPVNHVVVLIPPCHVLCISFFGYCFYAPTYSMTIASLPCSGGYGQVSSSFFVYTSLPSTLLNDLLSLSLSLFISLSLSFCFSLSLFLPLHCVRSHCRWVVCFLNGTTTFVTLTSVTR